MEQEMKKIAKQRVNLIIEYIEQILSDTLKVDAKIEISIHGDYCTLDINVPQNGFERHFNMIKKEYDYLIYEDLFNEIFTRLGSSSYIIIRPLCRIIPSTPIRLSGTGIRFENLEGSTIVLDFINMTKEGKCIFNEQGDLYNQKIEEEIGRKLTKSEIRSSYFNVGYFNLEDDNGLSK